MYCSDESVSIIIRAFITNKLPDSCYPYGISDFQIQCLQKVRLLLLVFLLKAPIILILKRLNCLPNLFHIWFKIFERHYMILDDPKWINHEIILFIFAKLTFHKYT